MTARINLAPEVYQKSQLNKQRRQLATRLGITITSVSVGFVVLMLILLGGQKAAIAALSGDIKNKQQEIKEVPDVQKAATAQQNLEAWNKLTKERVRASRFFQVLETFVPQGIAVSSVTVSEANQIEMTASARNYALATKLVKALEAANVEIGPNAALTSKPFFTDIQLTGASESAGAIDFKLTLQMDSEVTHGN
ncbi:MAG TPA: PilN domain-containing protein [Candidatus Dormibacteraeota bacterium]|nr:PilN domain-containing protein [Candidatus Dormibacteraeota bacterium]